MPYTWTGIPLRSIPAGEGYVIATRCRIIECINRWLHHLENTQHVPAGPYVGVLPLR